MMINSLIERIEDELELKINSRILPLYSIYQILYEVLYLKYLCDEKVLKYDDIMQMENLSELKMNDDYLSFTSKVNYKKLLHDIQYENFPNMIKEFANGNSDVYDHLLLTDKRKLIVDDYGFFTDLHYDLTGRSTYIIKNSRFTIEHLIFKLFDKVLDLDNDYKKIDEVELSEYDELQYYKMIGRIASSTVTEKMFEEIAEYIHRGLRVILFTNYNCINNYRHGRITLRSLKDVIFLPHDKAILIYEKKDNDDISIINFTEENNLEKLVKIITNDRKIKDTLIKVKFKDIVRNNCRLGFRLYQLEHVEKNKTINEIVDHNTHLIERLERINEVVEKEINFLINK